MTRSLFVLLAALGACSKSEQPPAPSALASAAATSAASSVSPAPSTSAVAPLASSDPSASASNEIAYVPYANGRFCFQLDTPRGMIAGPPPANGDGQSWKSTDGTAELSAWGQNIVTPEQSLDAQFDDEIKETKTRKVTLKTKGRTWFVVSGYDGAKIFYEKYTFAADHFAAFVVRYPTSGKEWWSRAVGHMGGSFHLC